MLDKFIDAPECEVTGDNFVMSGVRWLNLADAASDDFKDVDCYMSLMAQRGMVIWHAKAPEYCPEGVVIGSCERGALLLGLEMKRGEYSGKVWAAPKFLKDDGALNYKVLHIRDSTNYVCRQCSIASTLEGEEESGLIMLVSSDPASRLEDVVAETGFRDFTVPRMDKIVTHWKIPLDAKVHRKEADLALLLVHFFKPHLSLNDALACVACRKLRNSVLSRAC